MKTTSVEREVISIIKSRWAKGRETYGEGLMKEQQPTPAKWINEAIEECADMLQYLVAAKQRFELDNKRCKGTCFTEVGCTCEPIDTFLGICIECGLPEADCHCTKPVII